MFSKPQKTDYFCSHFFAPQTKWLNEFPLFGPASATQMLLKHSTGAWTVLGVCRSTWSLPGSLEPCTWPFTETYQNTVILLVLLTGRVGVMSCSMWDAKGITSHCSNSWNCQSFFRPFIRVTVLPWKPKLWGWQNHPEYLLSKKRQHENNISTWLSISSNVDFEFAFDLFREV